MSWFFNPMLLGGLALIAVPIVLHLIMRQRPRHFVFPAIQFLKNHHQANRRRLRLRQWLLLLLRVLLLALFVFALARPRMAATPGALVDQQEPVAAVMVVDTSPRMGYRHENATRLEKARELGGWLIGQLPADSQVSVMDSALLLKRFEFSARQAQQRLDRLETVGNPYPMPSMVEQALDLLTQKPEMRKELYILTDRTEQAWTAAAFERVRGRLQQMGDVGVYVIDVGVDEPRNVAVGDLRLSADVVSRNSPLRLRTEIWREGPADSRAVTLLTRGESGAMEERQTIQVDLPADGAQPVEFDLTGLPEGWHQGEVRLVGDDGLALDDVRYFTAEVRPAWKVLLVGPDTDSTSYLAQALAPESWRARGRARYDVRQVDYAGLLETPLTGTYSIVGLVDPPAPLPADTWDKLHRFVSQGGGLGVFLGAGARTNPEHFNEPGPQRVLPAELLQEAWSGEGEFFLNPAGQGHPILARFASLREGVPWELLPVYRFWQVTRLKPGAQRVMNYQTDDAALIDFPVGQGKTLLFTTSVGDSPNSPTAWNELVLEWPFIMLADQMALHLAGSLDGQLNYRPGQPASLPLPDGLPKTNFAVTLPDGGAVTATSIPGSRRLTFAETQQVGNYRLRGRSDDGPIVLAFSTNYPRTATELRRASPELLAEAFGDYPFQLAADRTDIERAQSTGRVGFELFPWLMVALVVVLFIEALMANRFYRFQDVPPPRVVHRR